VANASFCWEDPLLLDSQLAADERIVRNAAHDYAQKKLMPRIRDAFRHEQMDAGIFREMGEMGLLGCTLPPAYGGCRSQLRFLRSDRPRNRACRFGLSNHDERAIFAGHGADLRIRLRGTEAEIPAQARPW
jgi:alkylation response protein AidB-like acyl-CoA dehydrogenase